MSIFELMLVRVFQNSEKHFGPSKLLYSYSYLVSQILRLLIFAIAKKKMSKNYQNFGEETTSFPGKRFWERGWGGEAGWPSG